MGITYTSRVAAPIDEVFAWHSRPGAFARLSPPWAPPSLVREADSLEDGTAVLSFGCGLKWVAKHQAARYHPPNQFVDQLDSWPLRSVMTWTHHHGFSEVDPHTTRVTDTVDTPVPTALLQPMFRYRHRQLTDDLATHDWAVPLAGGPLTIAMTGASGLVGAALRSLLTTGGHRVIPLVRRNPSGRDERRWNPTDPAGDLFAGVDAVVHLAGASIAGRFNDKHKSEISDSRIGPTAALARVAAATTPAPTFVCASAIGFYGYDRGDTVLDESSSRGDGFLADVVSDWEAATAPAAAAGRVVNVRTGIVQAAAGGTLKLLRPLFTLGLGGRLGDGNQWLSWIGIDDLIDIYYRAIVDERLSGPVNAVAPHPVRNKQYTTALAGAVHRPAIVPVPRLGPQIILGSQGARELALANQRVAPARLEDLGHRFRMTGVDEVLRHQLGGDPNAVHV
ncbi:TIGR01777 family oxidoreductase [Williamsia sp.]|uniref:TIGR01777 family oxidoreductase n=1 Tax=Williamsia sp. TaxID=1872085 RepID=UPI002F93E829